MENDVTGRVVYKMFLLGCKKTLKT